MARVKNKRYSGGTYHWCPKGCGKSIIFSSWHPIKKKWVGRGYYCARCGRKFEREEIDK